VLMGQPCSGKSTLACKLGKELPFCRISSDRYIPEPYDKFFDSFVPQAQKLARRDLLNAVLDRKDIIWDQTNLNFKYQFPKEYYTIGVIMPYVSWERTEQVNKLRHGKTISKEVWDNFAKAYVSLVVNALRFSEVICAPEFKLSQRKVG